jgi:uncharacterized metal-binding protein YceD (DUF177 family)
MTFQSDLTHYLKLSEIPERGVDVAITAKPGERASIAERLGLPAIDALEADLSVRWRDAGSFLQVTGTVTASVVYDCVVSLEPFAADLAAEIDESFDPRAASEEQGEIDLGDLAREDAPEPLTGNRLDLGELVIQCLSLALDPHPRRPGAEPPASVPMDEGGEEDDPSGPFAALERLKRRG